MLAGLSITLADQKAILFYLGFFPVFVDLSDLSIRDALMVMLIAVVSVGGVKVCYAALTARAGGMVGLRGHQILSRLAGGAMMAAGVWMWWRVVSGVINPS
jgi:threonine/homoserine/homoserine lactone efflux protein